MSLTDEILGQIPMNSLAERIGVDESVAKVAAEAAIPTLLAGFTRQADDPERRQGLAEALVKDHTGDVIDAADPVALVDIEDGAKIINHVFGGQTPQVETQLQGFLGGGNKDGLVAKLLPILAPIVMSYLAKKMTGGAGAQANANGGGVLGDVLGAVLSQAAGGNAGAQANAAPNGGLVGAVLGSVLGGGENNSTASVLGDVIGAVLGGGQDAPVSTADAPASAAQGSGLPGGPGGDLGAVLGQLGGQAGKGGGLDDLLGAILGGK